MRGRCISVPKWRNSLFVKSLEEEYIGSFDILLTLANLQDNRSTFPCAGNFMIFSMPCISGNADIHTLIEHGSSVGKGFMQEVSGNVRTTSNVETHNIPAQRSRQHQNTASEDTNRPDKCQNY